MSKQGKIMVAMSGGIDSSVAAMLLHEQGYEVIGVTMKTWDYQSSGSTKKTSGCCSLDDINDARILAINMGFHHLIIDIREEFDKYIVSNFVNEYLAGRTPNPCVLCNTHIKWEALIKRANQLDCEFIATGHYAQVREENNRFIISKGVDEWKDQSYVLWGLSQQNLKRTVLPLGKFKKNEIRQMAKERGFEELSQKAESYEICFVPDNDYRSFLNHKVEGLQEKLAGGDFVDASGKFLGKHRGYPFYTVGQRKGLEIALGEAYFVIRIHPETNQVVLGTKEELNKQVMFVKEPNLIKYESLTHEIEALTKIRYKDAGTFSTLSSLESGNIKVDFHAPVSGIAPGQSAVFYEENDLLGGGFICNSNLADE
ncbi:MAG: tRNA 2-thiouridine(34) synthase MnmA [Bacteroidetes bacterium]|nr:tRNA 2-thiouridine(34) synthase MnmA [Bacteroidota bacterium]MBV6459950.1 tRNA-specific 2-thiouridylase MnmA [Flavobacteriales bacterium]WKZ76405.1 MAG: tRNA 2-thiouridine(34) synthase MnmA [Vicingaceae bacterium]MCL4816326.1 tRNA 2-thiouridine(34) synthase MnmA [Flavobacteriales bacterium]NOG95346.1 tRNA 2-thiouridine(34) synthase MnmA [Bacteroidota bacterium]